MNGKSTIIYVPNNINDQPLIMYYCAAEIKTVDEEDLYRRRLTRQVSTHTLNSFNELRLNVKLCDASLILDNGDVYPIHRSVLSGSSDYFRSVYTVHSK